MDQTTKKIVEISTDLFLENGIKCVTMDDVAQNLGMSKRTIYEHFDCKRSLLAACIEYRFEQKMQEELAIQDRAANIVEELFYLLKPSETRQALEHRFSLEMRKYYPDLFSNTHATHRDTISERIRARLVRGIDQQIILPDTNLDVAVYVIFETIYALISNLNRMDQMNFDADDLFRYAFISFFRGIATAEGVEMIDQMKDKITK